MTVTARQHPLRRQLGSEDHAVDVDIKQSLCDGIGLVDRAADRDDPGVVHQYVERSQPLFNSVEKIGKGSSIRHVQSAANLETQLAARLLDGRSVDIADRDLGAQTVQNRCRSQADPACATGDGNDLVCNRRTFHSLDAPSCFGLKPRRLRALD